MLSYRYKNQRDGKSDGEFAVTTLRRLKRDVGTEFPNEGKQRCKAVPITNHPTGASCIDHTPKRNSQAEDPKGRRSQSFGKRATTIVCFGLLGRNCTTR